MAMRQHFTQEFKLEAVRLRTSSRKPAAAIARELGLRRNHRYKWQLELEAHGQLSYQVAWDMRAVLRCNSE